MARKRIKNEAETEDPDDGEKAKSKAKGKKDKSLVCLLSKYQTVSVRSDVKMRNYICKVKQIGSNEEIMKFKTQGESSLILGIISTLLIRLQNLRRKLSTVKIKSVQKKNVQSESSLKQQRN